MYWNRIIEVVSMTFCSTLTSSWTCWINGLWYSKLMQLKIILSFSGDHYYYYGNVYQQITST